MTYKTKKGQCGISAFGFEWDELFDRLGLTPGVDTITQSTWTTTGGTQHSTTLSGLSTTVVVSGGVPGVPIICENVIEINGGAYRDCRKIRIEVY